MTWGNTPVYRDGQRIVLRETWRVPSRPFAPPICCKKPAMRLAGRLNVYRCSECWAKIEPERLWHRLLLWRNPMRASRERVFRRLFRVTRWMPVR